MEVQKFSFNGSNLIVLVKGKNSPLFVGKQVAKFLGYKDPTSAVSYYVGEEDKIQLGKLLEEAAIPKDQIPFQNHPWKIFITEKGFRLLVFGSKKKQANTFQTWFLEEVYPQIHRTKEEPEQDSNETRPIWEKVGEIEESCEELRRKLFLIRFIIEN